MCTGTAPATKLDLLAPDLPAVASCRGGAIDMDIGEERTRAGAGDTAADYPRDRCVQQLFEAQAARCPDATAAVFDGRALTYAELNARANRLAHYLRSRGVGPDVPVGVCLERSLELPVGILAVLKAGGAFVPLDPGYPAQRLAFMLDDAAVPVLLTQRATRDALRSTAAVVVCLDDPPPELLCQCAADPAALARPEHLAYVIYTSGSTGTPKGVMVEHRSLVNFLCWLQREYPLAPGDRLLQIGPTSFDISMPELFWPLIAGVPLEIAPPGIHRSAEALLDLVRRRAVTVLQVVPSMLAAMVETAGLSRLASLRRVFSVGEALTAALAGRFHAQSTAELVNAYGPTETTVYATHWRCRRDEARAFVPIGRPMANTRIMILDANAAPVPIGVAGEICIAGDGVARGYLGRPDRTAERFVPDPAAAAPSARMYRTGDRGRFLAEGNVEFLGRADAQIKLRGFRIEPGEIEAALAGLPQVRASAVALREDAPGDPRLVAYVVARGPAPTAAALRAALRRQLPEHMVPAAFVVLAAIPLTPAGKTDHRALPAPGAGNLAESGARRVAPLAEVELQLAAIWGEVLGLEHVGVGEDFFDLGGHSLLAMRVLSRMRQRLGVDVNLREFFEASDIERLAESVVRARAVPQTQPGARAGGGGPASAT